MKSGRIKGCFESATKLRRLNPTTLCGFLSHFPLVLSRHGIVLPAGGEIDADAYQRIADALMSETIPEELAVLMLLVGKLGNETGWHEIQEEAKIRRISLSDPKTGMSYHDRAMQAWIEAQPGHPDLLEEAFARARIYAKSSYTYYPMISDVRNEFKNPTKDQIQAIEHALDQYFHKSEKLGEGAKVLAYDYDAEIWFLIRHPGIVQRQGVYEGAKSKTLTYTPELYDAVVYHKTYGDLRMNTERGKEQAKYRIEFAHLLFNRENVFHPTAKIIDLEPLKQDVRNLCKKGEVRGLKSIVVSEVTFFCSQQFQNVRVVWRAYPQNEGLAPYSESGWVVPESTDTVLSAKFRYELSAEPGKKRTLTVHRGKKLNYERDGDSCILEEWLRLKKIIKSI
jgi:hypothetical protein